MAIANNAQAKNAFNRGDPIPVEFLGGLSNPAFQLAAQCLSFEVLLGWMGWGTVAAYNALGEPEPYTTTYTTILNAAVARVALNPATALEASLLTSSDKEIARLRGESYFEQGYPAMAASIDPSAKRTLLRETEVR